MRRAKVLKSPRARVISHKTVPGRLRHSGHASEMLYVRVAAANVALIAGGAMVLAFSPLTVSKPLMPVEGAELFGWVLAVVLIDLLILRALFQPQSAAPLRVDHGGELTAREIQIVQLIAQSLTAKQIAETLTISPKTVDAHRGHILKKLGLRDRVALTRYAIKRGWVEP